MMTEKEKDLQICKELTEIATDVFNKYCAAVPADVYSVVDLLKKQGGRRGKSYAEMISAALMIDARKNKINIIRRVCVGSFCCEFCAGDVFGILAKFEKLAGLKKAQKALFNTCATPCTSGERCDVYEGAPVRELLPVYDSAEGCAVDPALLPAMASAAPVVDLLPVVEEYAKTLQAVEVLKRSISRGWVSPDLLASAGLSSAASAPDVAPVVVSSRPSACGVFRTWWRTLVAAVVALLAWCGLSLSSGEPSEVAPDDGDSVAAVVAIPAVDCVAVVPGVALPDVVCIGDAVPLELPAVDCVASAHRLTVAPVTAQDLAACGSSGACVGSVAVPHALSNLLPISDRLTA